METWYNLGIHSLYDNGIEFKMIISFVDTATEIMLLQL